MYKKEDVLESALKHFRGNTLSANVWLDKYCLKDGDKYMELSPSDTHKRLAKEFARIESNYPNPISYEEILELLEGQVILPGGSLLYGIGNNYSISSLGNCFVIGNTADSYGGICTTDQEQVQLMKRRAGVGHDISHIRPNGTPVTNAAGSSTGPISFMPRFSSSTREVAQDGRRGALMLSINMNHPNAGDFIESKADLTKITGANISVKIDDNFMNSIDPNTTYSPNSIIWNKLVHQAWKTAEPGVLFWDKVISESPADCYEGFTSTSTNPCVSADTKILTSTGYFNIQSCIGEEVDVWNGKEFSRVTPKITGKTNEWYIIKFSDGTELKCTPYHKFYLKDEYRDHSFEARELKIGTQLARAKFPIIDEQINENLYTQGFYCGDGSTKREESIIDLYGVKRDLLLHLDYRHAHLSGDPTRLYLGKKLSKTYVPNTGFSIKSKLSYLAGLIDSDGALNDSGGSLNISSINREFLMNVKYLLNTLGTTGVVSLMKNAELKPMPDGKGGLKKYQTQDCYRIVISATNVKKLMDLGLNTHRVKLIANPSRDASRFITVIDIQTVDVEQELTYCFTEPKDHRGVFNGVLTGQCGEIPLCPYDSCRLLSVNLYSFVDKPFTSEASINWDRFNHTVAIAQKLMDDVVDLEEEKINLILKKIDSDPESEEIKQIEKNLWLKIKEKLLQGRRTGLSGIGLADTLAALGSGYSDGIDIAESIYKALAISAYKSSIDMAADRGAFPIYNIKREFKNPFLTRIGNNITPKYLDIAGNHGRRNIALLTIPPSGTIAQKAEINNGVEPVYDIVYKRRRKVDPNHPNVSFTDKNGDTWEEYKVWHHKFVTWLEVLGWDNVKERLNKLSDDELKIIIKESPYHNSTAYELNPIDRVKMQGRIQKWVDHSISSTVNLPNSATEEDISNIYMTAWKEGCKGITVYRDGCRDGVLISADSKEDTSFNTNNATKRPKYISCDIFTPKTQGQQYVVAVGVIDDKPYEIFAFKHDEKVNITKGFIKKVNRGRYDILDGNKNTILEDITSEMSQIEEDRTRLMSWGLRHGGGIKFLVEQLGKAKGNGFQAFSKVIARVLKRYIVDSEKVTGEICPNCSSTDLVYKEGCKSCNSCGYEACS